MILTHSVLHSAGTRGIGFNRHQLAILGVSWPPTKGWLSNLIGTEIDDAKWEVVMALKDRKLSRQAAQFRLRRTPEQTPIGKIYKIKL